MSAIIQLVYVVEYRGRAVNLTAGSTEMFVAEQQYNYQ